MTPLVEVRRMLDITNALEHSLGQSDNLFGKVGYSDRNLNLCVQSEKLEAFVMYSLKKASV